MTRRRKQNIKLALVCAILGAIVLMTIFAPWLAPYDPLEVNMELRLLDPCRAHPLGTDALGRDVLSRVIYGGRASLLLAVAATACSMASGMSSRPHHAQARSMAISVSASPFSPRLRPARRSAFSRMAAALSVPLIREPPQRR